MGTEKRDMIKRIIVLAGEEARALGNNKIYPEHLVLGFIKAGNGQSVETLTAMGVDWAEVERKLKKHMVEKLDTTKSLEDVAISSSTDLAPTFATAAILRRVHEEAWKLGDEDVEEKHLFLSILYHDALYVCELLSEYGVDYAKFKDVVAHPQDKTGNDSDDGESDLESDDEEQFDVPIDKGASKNKGSVIDNYGTDLTKAAQEGKLDPIIGRNGEIDRMVQILSRRKKNNPILIGEPGVGKSAIAEGLALRIVQKRVSCVLYDKRVIALDIASIVAGTKYRGQFEERMKTLIKELSHNRDIILFIDEIHTIVGAGGSAGSLDAANILKPALARGEIQCIGATTLDEYRQSIEKDGALERRFQKILVEATTYDETVEILKNIRERYEDHHHVRYTDGALEMCVRLTERYVSDRALPDKAIDAMDEAGSRAHLDNVTIPVEIERMENSLEQIKKDKKQAVSEQQFEVAAAFRDEEREMSERLEKAKSVWRKGLEEHRILVDEKAVEEVVALMTGIPVTKIANNESSKLLNMKSKLEQLVVGQSEAIDKIVRAIQRNRAGLKDPNRPIGSFIFLGPTGVGKTQLAKELASELFDTPDALIRIDMSEYMEKFAVSRLVGAPPGYVGYEEGGQLTEKVRRKPYSVVLLDEIEKAHPDTFNILLQLLDDGHLTDSLGRRVDFRNTIIIMTSNVGTRQLKDFGRGIGFSSAESDVVNSERSEALVKKALKNSFSPEFLNRIDDVVFFNPLSKEDLKKIVTIELNHVMKRVSEYGCDVEISDAAKLFLADKSYNPEYGARPLKRAIQKYFEDELSEAILRGVVTAGTSLVVDVDANSEKLVINKK